MHVLHPNYKRHPRKCNKHWADKFPIYYSIPQEETKKNLDGQVVQFLTTIGVMVPISPRQSV